MPSRSRIPARAALACLLLAVAAGPAVAAPACDPDDGGLSLPAGLCALVFARDTGPVRNLVVSEDGTVYAALLDRNGSGGGVLALRDTDGDGRADVRARFGSGDGHGIALDSAALYFAAADRVVRWPRPWPGLVPRGAPETMVFEFPKQSEHREKAIALGPDHALYVEVGAPSNACQQEPRTPYSPGLDPCPQRNLQAGIWHYWSDTPTQHHDETSRFARGMRHTLALAVDPGTGALWGAIAGRDQLHALWGWSVERNARLPAEQLVHVVRGADFGWPYCYEDGIARKKVLAPEYGGDGKKVGRCAGMRAPALSFPAHWTPMAMLFYTGRLLPARYRGGAFVAFHGSWNRAPLPQQGFRVSFVPFRDGRPTGSYETFAIGAGAPTRFRMSGLAQGPDGSLYLAADANQLIWRVLPKPGAGSGAPAGAAP